MNKQNHPTLAQNEEMNKIVKALEAHFETLRTDDMHYHILLSQCDDDNNPGDLSLVFVISTFTNGKCDIKHWVHYSTAYTPASSFLRYISMTAKEYGVVW